ncbi:DUF4124 domain-containing protein [Pseudomonadota bacterium]
MKHVTIRLLFAVLVVFVLAAQGEAQEKKMYSWTDENGTIHFSESKPAGQDVMEQTIPAGDQQPSSNPYATTDTGPSAADQRRQEIAQKREQAQMNQAVNSAQCASWKAEVDRLEPNRRVFFTNEQGETERMDDVKRTDRVAELKSLMAKNCK